MLTQDVSIMGLDPGLDMFGYSCVSWNAERMTYRFNSCGRICTSPNQPTISRARDILRGLKQHADSLPSKVIYVLEKPQECLYDRNQARIMGVLKLFAIIYAVIGALAERDQIVFDIYPLDWQPGKAELKTLGLTVKKWSRLHADLKLKALKVTRKKFIGDEQDIADAVNICDYGVNKFHKGEWVL